MDKFTRFFSTDSVNSADDSPTNEEEGFAAQLRDATTFSWSTRIRGFLICFIGGFVLSIIGISLLGIPFKGPILFGLFYTIGNVMSIASTCFLMGPWKQLKKMFNETRIFATIGMVVFMILTLVSALVRGKIILTLILCVCQFLSITWYSLSYIPYARDAVKKTVTSCI